MGRLSTSGEAGFEVLLSARLGDWGTGRLIRCYLEQIGVNEKHKCADITLLCGYQC